MEGSTLTAQNANIIEILAFLPTDIFRIFYSVELIFLSVKFRD